MDQVSKTKDTTRMCWLRIPVSKVLEIHLAVIDAHIRLVYEALKSDDYVAAYRHASDLMYSVGDLRDVDTEE